MPDDDKAVSVKATAKVMHAASASVGAALQLEATFVLLRALYGAHVKVEHRLSMFDKAVMRLRADIEKDIRNGRKKANGKTRNH